MDYAKGKSSDKFLNLTLKPAADLTIGDKKFIMQNFFLANWENMIRPFYGYWELLKKRGFYHHEEEMDNALRYFTEQDFLDLQVLFNLAWIDPAIRQHDRFLKGLVEKDKGFTEEDKKKGILYAEQRKRKEFQKSASDITQYLKDLKMVVTIEKANSFNMPRISQLTQKTNQFNMTTRRYAEEDINKFSKSNNFLVLSLKVVDKFGDNGITGAAIVEKGDDKWRIDAFLLSCRIIGRRVEEVLLAYILKEAKKEGVKTLIGEFIPTQKNIPAKNFNKNSGFQFISRDNNKEIWQYDVAKKYNAPNFVNVMIRDDK